MINIILILLLIISYYFCRSDHMVFYMTYIYPIYRNTIGRIANIIPYSLFQWVVLFMILFLIYLIFKNRKYILPYLLSILLIYQLTCGMIYQRKDLPENPREISQKQINELTTLLMNKIDHLSYEPLNLDQIIELCPSVMNHHEKGYYPNPKKVIGSSIMSDFGITGIYSPFTIEANINIDGPLCSIPFTACHELSHLYGYMKEEQAQYNAYKACVESNIPYFEYSAYYQVIFTLAAHYSNDITLPQYFKDDKKASIDYWQNHEGYLSELEDKVNDTYLMANGDTGIVSYNQLIYDLLDYYNIKG